jgi:hypothetical protein
MRSSLVVAFTLIIFGTLSCRAADTSTDKVGDAPRPGGVIRPSAKLPADWKQGLQNGPNGPVPFIVVDQFGYPTRAKKVAVIRKPQTGYDNFVNYAPGSEYALVDVSNGTIVKVSHPVAWNGGAVDQASGDRAWWFDFSDVTTPGRYAVLDIERGVRSVDFAISDGVYKDVLRHAVRAFFYQRAGFEKKPEFAGAEWADKASHLGPRQDAQTQPWPAIAGAYPRVRDLRGGWYDAGDYNKYTNWTARDIIMILRAFDNYPQAFGDDMGLPESGNGVPDVLDEMKWGLDWLIRMQNEDGSVLCVQGLANGSPPSAAKGPSYYGPATTSASLMTAAAFAYASRIFAQRQEAGLKAYAADLARRARAAWDWAGTHDGILYYNNDDSRQPGSKGLASGQQELSDAERNLAKIEAAIYLYELSGDPALKQLIETSRGSIVPAWGPNQWDVEGQEAILYYTRLADVTPGVKAEVVGQFFARMNANSSFAGDGTADAYRATLKDYTWGSNKSKASQSRLFALVGLYSDNAAVRSRAMAAAIEYAHYIHGVNPLGIVYLTNMGATGAKHSVGSMWHTWFAPGTKWEKVRKGMPGPPPGYLVGGPNPSYSVDGCCKAPSSFGYACGSQSAAAMCKKNYTPPGGQPALKSYLDFNDNWPGNSWAVTEPSMLYQASYIRMLAAFVP